MLRNGISLPVPKVNWIRNKIAFVRLFICLFVFGLCREGKTGEGGREEREGENV